MKRLYLYIIMYMVATYSVVAQNIQNPVNRDITSFSPLKSLNQQIIEQVVNSGVFIIKQSYELADSTGNRYGYRGNRAFGTDYSLAVKIRNGFVISDRTIHPWDYNSLFDKYRKKYTPQLFPTSYSEVSKVADYDSIKISEESLKILEPGLLYQQESNQFFGDGFSIGACCEDNEGWMVWFTKKRSLDFDKTTQLNISVVKKKIENSSRKEIYLKDSLSTNDEIIGGIYVIPEIIGVGKLEIKLWGICCRIGNGWV